MKLKYEMEIVDICGELTVVPLGADGFNGVMRVNETAADMIKLLKEEKTEEGIVEELAKLYDASADEVRDKIKEPLNILRSNGLLEE